MALAAICGVVAASTASAMSAAIRAALKETPTIELRLDWLSSDNERSKLLAWLKSHRPANATFLATCRRKGRGRPLRGRYPGSTLLAHPGPRSRLPVVRHRNRNPPRTAQQVRPRVRGPRSHHAVDPRLQANPRHRALLSNAPPRGSRHDQNRRPFANIADSVRLLKWAEGSKDCIAVPMGEVGLPARILALKHGSTLEYAPVGAATAPGQVSLHDLKHLYRAHELNRSTRVYGVIGDPIGHSLSPLLHNSAFAAKKMNAVYLAIPRSQLVRLPQSHPRFRHSRFQRHHPPQTENPEAPRTLRRSRRRHRRRQHRRRPLRWLARRFEYRLRRRASLARKETPSRQKPRPPLRRRRLRPCRRRSPRASRRSGRDLRAPRTASSRTRPRRRRRSRSALRSALRNVRRHSQHHSRRHAPSLQNFSSRRRRAKLSHRHGPHLSARAHAAPANRSQEGHSHRQRRRNVPRAGNRAVGTVDKTARARSDHAPRSREGAAKRRRAFRIGGKSQPNASRQKSQR